MIEKHYADKKSLQFFQQKTSSAAARDPTTLDRIFNALFTLTKVPKIWSFSTAKIHCSSHGQAALL